MKIWFNPGYTHIALETTQMNGWWKFFCYNCKRSWTSDDEVRMSCTPIEIELDSSC